MGESSGAGAGGATGDGERGGGEATGAAAREGVEGAAGALRERGNVEFKARRFAAAAAAYSAALEALGPASDSAARYVLLTNRSNARFADGDAAGSLADADAAIALDQQAAKGYFRRGAAQSRLGDERGALTTYRMARDRCSAAADRAFFAPLVVALETKTGAARSGEASVSPPPRRGARIPSLYPERAVVASAAERERAAAVRAMERLRTSLRAGRDLAPDTLLDGLFGKLLVPERFRQVAYRSAELPKDPPGLPPSLQALLLDDANFEALVALLPRAQARADQVLANVKSKGQAEGQVMDEATERMLRPQVLNESLAHLIVDMVSDVNRRQNALIAQARELMASPDAPEASFDQLAPGALEALGTQGWCVLDGFLDDDSGEWHDLLRADAVELALRSGLMEARDVASANKRDLVAGPENPASYTGLRSCWLSLSQLEDQYPALHELATRVCALPHELNRKAPHLRLARPLPVARNILLLCSGPLLPGAPNAAGIVYAGHAPRFDGSFGEANNGYSLSAEYTFNAGWDVVAMGGATNFRLAGGRFRQAPGKPHALAPGADRLALYRSRVIEAELEPVRCPAPARFSLRFFFIGPPDDQGEQW
jgi:hypothetical protein